MITDVENRKDVTFKKKITLRKGIDPASLKLFELENGKIVCVGYYSYGDRKVDKNYKDYSKRGKIFFNAIGVFKFDLVNNTEEVKVDYHDIPKEIINQNLNRSIFNKNKLKEKKGEVFGIPNFAFDTYHKNNDGSIVLIGEQFKIARGRESYEKIYKYGDVLITKVNRDGSLAWMKKLAKKQQSARDKGDLSVKLIKGKDDLYLLYMDEIGNLDIDLLKEPSRYVAGGGFLTAYKIHYNSGDAKKISLLDTRKVKGVKTSQFALSRVSSNTNDEFILEVYKKKKEDILIKVELK